MDKILSGKDGEEKACNYLKSKKYKILEKNYRCLYGEIDIIAKYNNTLVIIEVKYRKSAKFGKGYEAVNYTKQQKIIKTLQYYINEKNVKIVRINSCWYFKCVRKMNHKCKETGR